VGLETSNKIRWKPCWITVLQIFCRRSDHKTGKNMPMLEGGEHLILHQKQRDTGVEEEKSKRARYPGFQIK